MPERRHGHDMLKASSIQTRVRDVALRPRRNLPRQGANATVDGRFTWHDGFLARPLTPGCVTSSDCSTRNGWPRNRDRRESRTGTATRP